MQVGKASAATKKVARSYQISYLALKSGQFTKTELIFSQSVYQWLIPV